VYNECSYIADDCHNCYIPCACTQVPGCAIACEALLDIALRAPSVHTAAYSALLLMRNLALQRPLPQFIQSSRALPQLVCRALRACSSSAAQAHNCIELLQSHYQQCTLAFAGSGCARAVLCSSAGISNGKSIIHRLLWHVYAVALLDVHKSRPITIHVSAASTVQMQCITELQSVHPKCC
jgi:hypothetical protein